MKLFNFRPLCAIALLATLTGMACLLSPWAVVVVVLGLVFLLAVTKTPTTFKVVALVVFTAVVASFLLHTAFNPAPVYRTYDPNAGLRGVVLRYANGVLHRFLSDANAELLFSMLFGNKSGLPWLLRQDFSVAGIAHLLTVSGLHVGLLAGVVTWLLKICCVPRRARVFGLAPVLLFYAYLCGWQYAVLRAMIMCLVYEIARCYQRVADPLSALSIAATIIIVLFPYSLQSVSFWLSFTCVLGIILFYRRLQRVVRVPMLATYLSATLGCLPLLIYYFGYVSLYGIVANLVIVPLLVLTFYVGMLAVVTYVAGCLLWLINPVLTLCSAVCTRIAALPYAMIVVSSPVLAIVLYLMGLLLLSRFIFLPKKVKYPLAGLLFACYFLLLVV